MHVGGGHYIDILIRGELTKNKKIEGGGQFIVEKLEIQVRYIPHSILIQFFFLYDPSHKNFRKSVMVKNTECTIY